MKTFLLKVLCALSLLLRCVWLFFPGLLLIILAAVAFWELPQGKDIVRLCLEGRLLSRVVFILATVFWVFVTWYTARLIAYNHPGLFATKIEGTDFPMGKKLLFHLPRLMAYSIFTVLIVALFLYDDEANRLEGLRWSIVIADYVLYFLFDWFFEKLDVHTLRSSNPGARLRAQRSFVSWLVVACCVVALFFWGREAISRGVLLGCLVIVQLGFLFLVITRREAGESREPANALRAEPRPRGILTRLLGDRTEPYNPHARWDRFLLWVIGDRDPEGEKTAKDEVQLERRVFRLFNIIAAASIIAYFLAIFWMDFARLISPMPFIFLAFGILLGASSFLGILSHRHKVNWHFVLIAFVFIVGLFTEPHRVRLKNDSAVHFEQRMRFSEYLRAWMADPVRRDKLASDTGEYPVFFVLADGGASRSGYWTALVLSHLDSSTAGGATPFRQHLFCLSGASGGSVGNGTYLAATRLHSPGGAPNDIKKLTTDYLGGDFLSFTLARMLGPDLVSPVFWWLFGGDRAAALEQSMEHSPGAGEMSEAVQRGISAYMPVRGSTNLPPIICINTTRMQDGQPGVVSNVSLDGVAVNRLDVLKLLEEGQDMRLSTAMVLGARFPYISPAGRIGNQYFVDGGYFDNSGAGIVHEMILALAKMKEADTAQNSALKKLRFYVLHITNSPYNSSAFERVHAVKNDLAAPLLTLAGSYATQTDVNDSRLNTYIDDLNGGQRSHISINLYLKDRKESFPMNWVISRKMRAEMLKRVHQPALDSIIARLVRGSRNIYDSLDEKSAPDASMVSLSEPSDGEE